MSVELKNQVWQALNSEADKGSRSEWQRVEARAGPGRFIPGVLPIR